MQNKDKLIEKYKELLRFYDRILAIHVTAKDWKEDIALRSRIDELEEEVSEGKESSDDAYESMLQFEKEQPTPTDKGLIDCLPTDKEISAYANGAFGYDHFSSYQEAAFESGADWVKSFITNKGSIPCTIQMSQHGLTLCSLAYLPFFIGK